MKCAKFLKGFGIDNYQYCNKLATQWHGDKVQIFGHTYCDEHAPKDSVKIITIAKRKRNYDTHK